MMWPKPRSRSASVRRPFVSMGSRCCSDACERQLKERADIESTMAEVDAEPTSYVHRKGSQEDGPFSLEMLSVLLRQPYRKCRKTRLRNRAAETRPVPPRRRLL
jgi:hypothetical protein